MASENMSLTVVVPQWRIATAQVACRVLVALHLVGMAIDKYAWVERLAAFVARGVRVRP